MNKYFLLFAGLMASMTGFAADEQAVLPNDAIPESEAVVTLPDVQEEDEEQVLKRVK